MIGIGALAQLTGLTVRALRHYDELGVLRPAQVDPSTGYRRYSAAELLRAHRLVALRDLGLSLPEVRQVLDEELSAEELRGMLRLRRAEAQALIASETERLARVEARLAQLERQETMSEVVVKSVGPVRVAVRRSPSPGFGEPLGPILGGMYNELFAALGAAGVGAAGPAMALYAEHDDPELPVLATAAVPVAGEPAGVEVVTLPGLDRVASTIHQGSMATVQDGYEALAAWAEQAGETIVGYSREIYVACEGDQATWVTELQFELAPR